MTATRVDRLLHGAGDTVWFEKGVGTMPIDPSQRDDGGRSRIQHTAPQIGGAGAAADEAAPLPVAKGVGPSTGSKRITAFGKEKRHEDQWSRSPNTTGHGAIHVKTFHAKLTGDALEYMDQVINEWLDEHPQYEVKFVSSTVGTLTGKLKEPNIICQVWV